MVLRLLKPLDSAEQSSAQKAAIALGVDLHSISEISSLREAISRARNNFRDDAAIDEKFVKTINKIMVLRAGDMACRLSDTGHPHDALIMLREVVNILEEMEGPEAEDLSRPLNNLGLALKRLNKLTEAEQCYRRALAINEKFRGSRDSWVAINLRNLASVLAFQGRFNESRQHTQRAIENDESNFGFAHPSVALGWHNYAETCLMQGDLVSAEQAYVKALDAEKQSHGPSHPRVMFRMVNLAGLYTERGKLSEAQKLFSKATSLCPKDTVSNTLSGEEIIAMNNTIKKIERALEGRRLSTSGTFDAPSIINVAGPLGFLSILSIIQEALTWFAGEQSFGRTIAMVLIGCMLIPAFAFDRVRKAKPLSRIVVFLVMICLVAATSPWIAINVYGKFHLMTITDWLLLVLQLFWLTMLVFSLKSRALANYLADSMQSRQLVDCNAQMAIVMSDGTGLYEAVVGCRKLRNLLIKHIAAQDEFALALTPENQNKWVRSRKSLIDHLIEHHGWTYGSQEDLDNLNRAVEKVAVELGL